MSSLLNIKNDPIDIVEIKADGNPHISIRSDKPCEHCKDRPCTYYCPTGVFHWDEENKKIKVLYARCVECLACPFGCPQGNIEWHYPSGNAGVVYKYG